MNRIVYVSDEVSVRDAIGVDRGTFSFTVIARHDGRRTDASGQYFWLYMRSRSGRLEVVARDPQFGRSARESLIANR